MMNSKNPPPSRGNAGGRGTGRNESRPVGRSSGPQSRPTGPQSRSTGPQNRPSGSQSRAAGPQSRPVESRSMGNTAPGRSVRTPQNDRITRPGEGSMRNAPARPEPPRSGIRSTAAPVRPQKPVTGRSMNRREPDFGRDPYEMERHPPERRPGDMQPPRTGYRKKSASTGLAGVLGSLIAGAAAAKVMSSNNNEDDYDAEYETADTTENTQTTEAYTAPKKAVICEHCGATTIPDENNCCEYCGSSFEE